METETWGGNSEEVDKQWSLRGIVSFVYFSRSKNKGDDGKVEQTTKDETVPDREWKNREARYERALQDIPGMMIVMPFTLVFSRLDENLFLLRTLLSCSCKLKPPDILRFPDSTDSPTRS
jgi:hypothetical protein